MIISRSGKIRRRCLAVVVAVATAVGCTIVASAMPASAQPASSARLITSARPAGLIAKDQPAAYTQPALPADIISSGLPICLTNSNTYCLGVNPNDVIHTVVEVSQFLLNVWLAYKLGKKTNPPDKGDDQDEFKVFEQAGGSTYDTGLCLADTGGNAYYATCGANGTVWVVVPHSNGAYLASRYSLDHGNPKSVLSVNPLAVGSHPFVYNPQNPGTAYWQTFSSTNAGHGG